MPSRSLETPTGTFSLWEEDGAITRANWGPAEDAVSDLLDEAASQIEAYFNGTRTEFELPLKLKGSPLQQEVCKAMLAIPFGETRTYGDLARDLGVPAQAIGQACGGNPIALIIPCHRVLGAASLGGFSGKFGIETKVELLKHEGAASLLI